LVQISSAGNGSDALQALQTLMAAFRSAGVGGASSTGQSLPIGAGSTPTASLAPTLLGSSPAGQFASSALAFLTSLQDPRSAAASAAFAGAGVAVDHLTADLSSALNHLRDALDGSNSTASTAPDQRSGSAPSDPAGALTAGTASALLGALDQLGSAFGLFG
jgi:hypothetical protein